MQPQPQGSDHVLARAASTRRRARRALRQARELLQEHAAPATVSELARWSGLSGSKIRGDIAAGVIVPLRTDRCRGRKMLIARAAAVAYLRQLGVL